MHSSEKRPKKNLIRLAVCIIVFCAVLYLLDFALYPCTYMRNDIHTVTTAHHDVVFLGTSNGKMNLDPDAVLAGTGYTGHNLCNGNQYPVDSYYLLALLIEKEKPEVIVYEADPSVYTEEKEEGNNYLLFYHEFPLTRAKMRYFADTVASCDLRAMCFPFYEYPLSTELGRLHDTVYQKANNVYDVSYLKGDTAEYHENGWMERYPVSVADFGAMRIRSFSAETVREDNLRYLERLVQLCRDHGITMIATTLPQPEEALDAFPEPFDTAWDYFGTYFAERGIAYYNFNTAYYDAFPHDAAQYVDYNGHMNGQSAQAFSAVFGEIVFGE